MPHSLFESHWAISKDGQKLLRMLLVGRSLNFPCGMSYLGSVRADIDPKVKPHVIADLFKPFETFKPLEFDTVFCDPPYSYYCKFKWALRITDLARKRVIFCTPLVSLHLGARHWKKRIFVDDYPGRLFLRIYQVFDRIEYGKLGDSPHGNTYL